MHTLTITNPKTQKSIKARAWRIVPRAILQQMREGKIKNERDLSYLLLNDDRSIQDMELELSGEDSESNFALSVLENALDIRLGWAVIEFIRTAVAVKKLPKPFTVCVSRKGDIFIMGQSGNVYPCAG